MKFELDKEEILKLEEWQEAIKKIHGKYGSYKYIFEPTGIGCIIKVYSELAKTTLDLTDVSKW